MKKFLSNNLDVLIAVVAFTLVVLGIVWAASPY